MTLVAPLLFALPAYASLNDQIRSAEQQVSSTANQLNATKGQVQTLQGQVAALSGQIAGLQSQIASTQAQIDETTAKIVETEAELAARKKVLGELIKANYINAHTSTVEVLASSNSFSEFFSQQQYILSVKDRIDQLLGQIMETKKQLDAQQAELTKQQESLQGQESLVQQARANQQQLLTVTQGEEANYQAMLKGQVNTLNSLYAQRAALAGNTAISTGGTGGYPDKWALAPQDSMVDDWYYYNRECVSYVAWRRALDGRPTSGYGNAVAWPVNSSSPSPGAVAVWGYNVGPFGHVAYVESVNGDGSINLAQYNWDLAGHFSRMTVYPGSGLWPSKGFLR